MLPVPTSDSITKLPTRVPGASALIMSATAVRLPPRLPPIAVRGRLEVSVGRRAPPRTRARRGRTPAGPPPRRSRCAGVTKYGAADERLHVRALVGAEPRRLPRRGVLLHVVRRRGCR